MKFLAAPAFLVTICIAHTRVVALMLRITLAGILGATLALTGTAAGQGANTSVHVKTITINARHTIEQITGQPLANVVDPGAARKKPPRSRGATSCARCARS